MDPFTLLFGGESCRNLLLALAHTLWQGTLVAGILFLYLWRTPAQAADRRYLAGVLALAAILCGAVLTWSILNYQPRDAPPAPAGAGVTTNAPIPAPAAGPGTPPVVGPPRAPKPGQVWLLEAWLAGVILMLLRLVGVTIGGSRLRRSCRPVEDAGIIEAIKHLCARMGIGRQIRVLVGAQITTPGVVGCFWPTLLLPASMVTGIPAPDLQAILTHELAHIKRYDYLVNFLQMVVEALLFFNPAVWWISRQIRIEREACCDAAGVRWTGQSVKYAEILVAWAQRLRALPAPAVGFGREVDGGSVLDRVRRILIAGHQPRPRVAWHVATVMVVLTFACLIVIQQTTSLAVDLAGRILTPQERIDKIAGISKEYGDGNAEYGPEGRIRISGVVRTWDGKPLPNRTEVALRDTAGRSGGSYSSASSKDGTFQLRTHPGRFYLMALADGYAPVLGEPFAAEPGAHIEGIELLLENGFPGRIQTVDEGGRPIPGVELSGGYIGRPSSSYSFTSRIKLVTDANGIATLAHAGAAAMVLDFGADGYESERVPDLVLLRDQVQVITLKKAQPAAGVVLSQTTGQPIAGATIHIMASARGTQSWGSGSIARAPDAVANANGRFQLNRLRRDRLYLLFVRAPGYGYRYVPDVGPSGNIQVALGDKKTIRGTITGDLSLLATDRRSGGPVIGVENGYRYPESSGHSDASGRSPVTIRGGVGSFEIDDFWGQTVRLWAGPENVLLYPQEDRLDNIEINLGQSAQRQVVLRFATPAGGPPITGGVRIEYITDRARQQKQGMTRKWLDIRDGQARCEIPVPAQVKYSIDFLKRPVSYWFNEIQLVAIAAGESPYVIDVPIFPAGAIYGKILRPDGGPAEKARTALVIARKPDIENGQALSLSDLYAVLASNVEQGTFNATPLPLGGEYAVVAYEDYSFAMSNAFTLDEKNPIINVDLQLSQGVDVVGRLLDADETVARNDVYLDVSIKRGEHSWGMGGAHTHPDEEGRFVFKNVNVGSQGECSVCVVGGAGYRPLKHKIEDLHVPVVLHLEKGVRVTGTVIDDTTGWPVPGVEVYASNLVTSGSQNSDNWEWLNADGRTDAQGRFVFSNMARRQYQLGVPGTNIAGPRTSPIVTGGQSDPVTLRIQIPARSDLKPRQP